jgi:hypothetical protein
VPGNIGWPRLLKSRFYCFVIAADYGYHNRWEGLPMSNAPHEWKYLESRPPTPFAEHRSRQRFIRLLRHDSHHETCFA